LFLRNRVSAFPDRGARRPHESGDLVGIFDAGFTFDARRNVDPRGTGYAQGLADIVGVKPARKHERDTGLHRLEKMPIKSIAEPAWAGGVAWRARIKQQPIDHSSVMTDTLKVRPYRNWQSLHDWQAEHSLHRLNLRDGFCAVQLQNVRPQSLDDGLQKRCIGINGERHFLRAIAHLASERTRHVEFQMPRRWRKKHESHHVGAGIQRRIQCLGRR